MEWRMMFPTDHRFPWIFAEFKFTVNQDGFYFYVLMANINPVKSFVPTFLTEKLQWSERNRKSIQPSERNQSASASACC